MRTDWSSLRNKLFITLFEQKNKHLWHSCCPISLVISNMKFNRKLSEQFCGIDVSPYKVIGAALGCPRGVSKLAAEWQACLKETLVTTLSENRFRRLSACGRELNESFKLIREPIHWFANWFYQAFERNWFKRMNHLQMGIAHCPEKSRRRVWNKLKHL